MCGLTGIIDFSSRARERMARDLAAMHGRIPHRGQDGEGFLVIDDRMGAHRAADPHAATASAEIPRAGLGFRWLAIQDLGQDAMQPMSDPSGRLWIIFNGEIYNFVELRDELRREGVEFHTDSDTEVILAAYRRWGMDCFSRFEGMWAMLLADLDAGKVIGTRDRFGIKPLFYRVESDRILISSELKQLLAVSETRLNDNYLYQFLHGYRGHLTDETYYRDLHAVPPASHFVVDLRKPHPGPLTFTRWWELSRFAAMPRRKVSEPEAAEELETLLRRAVTRHIRARVKVGSFLSGGLDSTLVTAMIRSCNGTGEHEAYTTVFDRSRYAQFDESPYVDEFIRATPVPNYRATFDPNWLREKLPELTWIQEEPLIATTLFAQYRAFLTAKERGAVVVLDGQGSDEVFGGYTAYEGAMWRNRLLRGRLPSFLAEARYFAKREQVPLAKLLVNGLARPFAGSVLRRFGLHFNRYPWIDEQYFEGARKQVRRDEAAQRAELDGFRHLLERAMYSDIRYTSLPALFLFSDRSAMSMSIEARLPYLDHHLVEFAMQLPPELKTGFGLRKRLLRKVAAKYVPESIIVREKMGFVTPEREWLRQELRGDVLAALDAPSMARLPFLRIDRAREFANAFFAGRHADYRAVWRFLSLRQWVEAYGLA